MRLGPLTILVGPNGSGKSNFLDALAFMTRALETTPAEAIDERGGLNEILRRVPDQAESFSIAIDAAGVSGEAPFSQLYTGLSRPRFYNFNTETLRRPQPSAARPVLRHGGEALGEVLAALATDNPVGKARLDAYLSAIVQDATGVEVHRAGGYLTVALKTDVEGEDFEFGSLAMSDGTIRAVALLAALFQPEALDGRLPLVGIEEPETALHPAAAGVLFDALSEASERVQVIGTSQSPDLLDRDDLDLSVVRVVAMRDGLTVIGEVDEVSREIAAQKLYTLGALMRGDQLTPAPLDDAGTEG